VTDVDEGGVNFKVKVDFNGYKNNIMFSTTLLLIFQFINNICTFVRKDNTYDTAVKSQKKLNNKNVDF
jgi:hypothetical protein